MAINSTTTQNLVPVMTVFNSDGSCAGLVGPGGNFLAVPIGAQTPSTGNFTTLTTTGNVGVGVTPSAWGSTFNAIDLGNTNSAVMSAFTLWAGANAYQDSSAQWRYKSSTGSTLYAASNAGTHTWFNAQPGTAGNVISYSQQMTLDNSGNLGLGTATSAWTTFRAIEEPVISVAGYDGGTSNRQAIIGANLYYGATFGYTYKATDPASYYKQTNGIHSWWNAPSGTAGTAATFTQAMTLDIGGNLNVVQTTTGLGNTNGLSLQTVGNLIVNHLNGTATGTAYAQFGYNGAAIGSVTQSGTTGVLYNITSDARVKENIADADSASSLIDAVQVRQFDYRSNGEHQRYGFIAQELVEVVPEAVHVPADADEMMGVDFSKLVPLLVKEVQELRARVAVLEGKKR